MSFSEKQQIEAEIRRLNDLIKYCNDPNNPDLHRWIQQVKNLKAALSTYEK